MTLDSVLQIARSLHVPDKDIPILRSKTLHWLEHNYRDDRTVATLSQDEISRQARAFIRAQGTRFFQVAVENGIITGLADKRLTYRVAKMMHCQVRYKTRTVEARNRRRGRRGGERAIGSDTDETGSSTDSCRAVQEDQDYEPTIVVARSLLGKLHNTRLNAQPGMPICHSIEANGFNDPIIHLMQRKEKTLSRQNPGREGSEVDENEVRLPPATDKLTIRRKEQDRRKSSELRFCSTPPPLHKILNWNETTEKTSRQEASVEEGPTINAHNDPPLRLPNVRNPGLEGNGIVADADELSSLVLASAAELDFPNVDFTEFLSNDDVQDSSVDIDTMDNWKSSPMPALVKPPRCENTPPASGRSRLARCLNLKEQRLTHSEDHQTSGVVAQKMSDISQSGCRVYLGGDHFKVIHRDRADQALQSVFDVMNDFSRDCQIRCRNRTLSATQQKLEERVADSICQLIRRLRNSEQIWGDAELDQAETEII